MMKRALAVASLVMKPEGYNDGSLPSLIPKDRSGDFTFTRGSNLAATRVDENGLIEKGRENLLLQSNQFDTTWINISSSETSGQSGYDGSSGAWLIALTGGTATKLITQSLSAFSGIYTTSFYAKAGTHSIIQWGVSSQSDVFVSFDLNDGSVGSLSNKAIDASATSVGDGWYRIQVAFQASGAAGYSIAGVDSLSATRYQSTSSIGDFYIQDAQLEQGLVATDYIPTTTTTAQAGILENTPRLDYSGGATEPSLLLEPSRSNLVTNSEYFGGTDWIKSGGITITTNAYISSEGLQNASNLSVSAGQYLYKGVSLTSGTTYTISVYAKVLSGTNQFKFNTYSGTGNDFQSSPITATTEWQRFDYTFTAVATGNTNIYPLIVDGLSGGDFQIYGAQFEVGSYPTSYIPTYGTSVTRAADACSKTDASDVIGQTEGTIFYDFKTDNKKLYKRFALSDGGSSNWIFVGMEEVVGYVRAYVRTGGVQQFSHTKSVDLTNTRIKMALAYKENDFVLYVNGSLAGSASLGTIPLCNRIDVGSQNPQSSVNSESSVNQAIIFKERLTNAELATLTTI